MKARLAGALVLALPCVAIAQIAVLQIKIVEGEGAVHPPGARLNRPLTVEVRDDAGKPVAGAAVSFQLPANGPGGLFGNGLRTDLILTDNAGKASVHTMQLNRMGGQFRIRITAVKEAARAGAICTQYIGEGKPAKAAAAVSVAVASPPAAPPPSPEPAAEITPTSPSNPAAESGDITPTNARMAPGNHKKWIVLAAIAAGAGGVLAGVSRSKSSSTTGSTSTTTISSSCSGSVCIGTPTITIGHP